MPEDRAVFFDHNDYGYGTGFCRIEALTVPTFDTIDINDAIEYYELKRYFDDGARAKNWSDKQSEDYKNMSEELHKMTSRFFSSLNNRTIVKQYESIDDPVYRGEFWSLFDSCKLYNKINATVFNKLLCDQNTDISQVLQNKRIVANYGKEIRDAFIADYENIWLFLKVYYQKYFTSNKKKRVTYYLPDEFSGNDRCVYLESYIDSNFPHINVLDRIVLMQPDKEFPVTDMIRLKAKRRHRKEVARLAKTGVPYHYEIGVCISEKQTEDKKVTRSGNKEVFSYSRTWLLDTLDYHCILFNFIYLFEFVDIPEMRCSLVVNETQTGVFEQFIHDYDNLPRYYPENDAFQRRQFLSHMQMISYYDFLQKNGVRYEKYLEWFFTKYLQEEFNCPKMRVKLPSKHSSFADKCVLLCSAFESILKQFALFTEYSEIDFELFQMSSGSKPIGDIKSLVDNKYLYSDSKDFKHYLLMLFSQNYMLYYLKRLSDEGKQYSNFFQLFLNEKVYLSDYREKEQSYCKRLEENGFISIDETGLIVAGDSVLLGLAKDLYYNGYISRMHYTEEVRSVLQEWIDKGWLVSDSNLLSIPEVNYFNYILNRREYVNGFDIRNKYSHGIQQSITDIKVHKYNYFLLLRLFTILAIKINDDFILKEKQEESD